MRFLEEAEGEGFEPSSDETARNGFRDRRIRPLCHPSTESYGQMGRVAASSSGCDAAYAEPPEPGLARRGRSAGRKIAAKKTRAYGEARFPRTSRCGRRERRSGEGGIRTLEAGISPPNALAGRRLQPLGHFSGGAKGTAPFFLLQSKSPFRSMAGKQPRGMLKKPAPSNSPRILPPGIREARLRRRASPHLGLS
jgi:hypothetical protein